jgi:DNA polymerase gamma 1
MELSMDKFKGVDSDAIFRGDTDHLYYRLPHKDGDGHNVGNPLSKSFVKAIESGDLASAAAADGQADEVARKAAADATNMNVLCSYWISSRERIMGQMVVYDRESNRNREDEGRKLGMILPQVITMGTVTRRAVEATWLTASNAKKNRVGSELKAMVRAPPGYALVGADVDSEELWISSIMGDSQFGMHGASAIGWMTLEGTKSAGTDLHSKTANILGISRDAAKVFNYSRIYGAGQKHAVQLLLQGDPSLSKEDATTRAEELYKQTKGSKANRTRTLPSAKTPSLWHGGSESYLFNTLETIAHAERPTTPALGCGVTRALTKGYLESESSFLPSRINWVVQSSGVDYLHLLIVSMEYLIETYGIQARYLISVHDEVRYLAKEEDRYRTALALQIANAWTRALFCYNLGMDDMPQGVAFFSAVDVDKVLRKEVFMGCETPSHPNKIPEGESLGVEDVLKITGGSLGPVIASTPPALPVLGVDSSASGNASETAQPQIHASLYKDITSPSHRLYLQAQAAEGSALARSWLDRQAPIESQAQAMVRNVRKKVRNFGPARGAAYGRGRGAKADAVMARVK